MYSCFSSIYRTQGNIIFIMQSCLSYVHIIACSSFNFFSFKYVPVLRLLQLKGPEVNYRLFCHIIFFIVCHFSSKASALCKFSMAVLTSSYCKALAAKRQYFWACSFSFGVRVAVVVLLGWMGTSATTGTEGGTDGCEGWNKYKAHWIKTLY